VGLLDGDVYGPNVRRCSARRRARGGRREGNRCPPSPGHQGHLDGDAGAPRPADHLERADAARRRAAVHARRGVGRVDYLVVDLPPGTGTWRSRWRRACPWRGDRRHDRPQGVSVSDVKEAVGMFRQLNIPVLGVIEKHELLRLRPLPGADGDLRQRRRAAGAGRRDADPLPRRGADRPPACAQAGDEGLPIVSAAPTPRPRRRSRRSPARSAARSPSRTCGSCASSRPRKSPRGAPPSRAQRVRGQRRADFSGEKSAEAVSAPRASIPLWSLGTSPTPWPSSSRTGVRERLGPRVRKVVLFGSRARGDARDDSDYDVVRRRRSTPRDVRETLLEIEMDFLDRHGSLVACLLRDEREWAASQGLPIGLNVAREGVALWTPEVAGLLAHARGKLEAARVLLEARAPGDAASRAYYAASMPSRQRCWPAARRSPVTHRYWERSTGTSSTRYVPAGVHGDPGASVRRPTDRRLRSHRESGRRRGRSATSRTPSASWTRSPSTWGLTGASAAGSRQGRTGGHAGGKYHGPWTLRPSKPA